MPRSSGTHLKLPAYDRVVRYLDGGAKPEDLSAAQLRNLTTKIERYRAEPDAYHAEVLKITTKAGKVVPFRWKLAQRRLFERSIKPRLERGEPVRIYILKARQMGFSTMIEALAYSEAALRCDVNAFVATHELESVYRLFNITKLFYRRAPEDLRPTEKRSNRYELHFANPSDRGDEGLESHISVASATNENLGASRTIKFAHLSEFALYDQRSLDVASMIATFEATVPDVERSFIFKETTARQGYGKDDWYAENSYDKVFVSWVADETYTAASTSLRLGDLSHDPDSEYGDEVEARELIARELREWYPDEAADPRWLLAESMRRLDWRRTKIRPSAKKQAGLALFRREYPLSPEEAFAVSSRGVFDSTRLTIWIRSASERVVRTRPVLEHWSRAGRVAETSSVVDPSTFEGLVTFEKKPVRGASYLIGLDPGGGYVDSDYSAAQVLRRGDGALEGSLFQVARFMDRIGPNDLAHLGAELGRFYNGALIIPEATGLGVALVSTLVETLHYSRVFLRRIHDTRLETDTEKWGFATSHATKPLLVATLQDMIRTGVLVIHDLATLNELVGYTADPRGKFGPSAGMHDDLVMSLALAVYGHRNIGSATQARVRAGSAERYSEDWFNARIRKNRGPAYEPVSIV